VLEVRDGALNTSNMIVTLCANQRPPVFYSSGDSLWIGFKSSSRPTNGSLGFEAIFSTGKLFFSFTGLAYGKSRTLNYAENKKVFKIFSSVRMSLNNLN